MGDSESTPRQSAGPLRVCVTGAECTGKTTLALELARHYAAPIVREYSRDYFAEKHARGDASVHTSDILKVTAGQAQLEDLTAQWTGPFIVCDTDVLTAAIWCETYLHDRCADVVAIDKARRLEGKGIDLYLLCAPDIPFVPDSLRTSGERRVMMHEVFREKLSQSGAQCIEVSGGPRQRLAAAIEAVEKLLSERGRPGRFQPRAKVR